MGIEQQPIRWSLTVAEGKLQGMKFVSQFVPEDMTRDVTTQYSTRTAMSRPHPVTQWISGNSQHIRFKARFVKLLWTGITDMIQNGLNGAATIREAMELLESLIYPDKQLGHPPRLKLDWGKIFQGTDVVIESLGGIKYNELTQKTVGLGGGEPTVVTFDITLMQVHQYNVPTEKKPGAGESLYYIARGETYEEIAAKAYNDPMKGVILRQRNGGWNPAIGQIVFVPSAKAMRKYRTEPKAIPLQDEERVKSWIHLAR